MTELGDELLEALHEDLLDDRGENAIELVFTNPTGDYDVDTGTITGEAANPQTVLATPPIDEEDRFLDGRLAEVGKARVFTRAIDTSDATFTPEKGTQVPIAGETWTVVRVKPLAAETTRVLAYELVISR